MAILSYKGQQTPINVAARETQTKKTVRLKWWHWQSFQYYGVLDSLSFAPQTLRIQSNAFDSIGSRQVFGLIDKIKWKRDASCMCWAAFPHLYCVVVATVFENLIRFACVRFCSWYAFRALDNIICAHRPCIHRVTMFKMFMPINSTQLPLFNFTMYKRARIK